MKLIKYLLKPYRWSGLLLAKPGPVVELLLIKRGNHPGKGTWSIPGGKVEAKDTHHGFDAFLCSAIREFTEEMLGIPTCASSREKLNAFFSAIGESEKPFLNKSNNLPCHTAGFPWLFSSKTFLYQLPSNVFNDHQIRPNWEIADWGWFPMNQLPIPLFCYMPSTVKALGKRINKSMYQSGI